VRGAMWQHEAEEGGWCPDRQWPGRGVCVRRGGFQNRGASGAPDAWAPASNGRERERRKAGVCAPTQGKRSGLSP
jgi:hypothetical protein